MDIEQALTLGFPPESAHRLHSRKDKCKAAEGSSSLSKDNVSPNISAFQSDAISVVSNPDVGRYMIVSSVLVLGLCLVIASP